jgi:hypothetical protein
MRKDLLSCRVTTLVTAGMVMGSLALLGFAVPASAANGVEPVTFTVTGGFLTLLQTPDSGTVLIPSTDTAMPVTTVTDGRNDVGRLASWTATNTASDLTETGATIPAADISVDQTGASFTYGTGTPVNTPGSAGTAGTVAVTADSIDSVYTYTPTANLTVPADPYVGTYSGTVTQTVT